MTYADVAHRYARDVTSGKVTACRRVVQACQRHLDDLAREDWDYRFDAGKADLVCRFVELLPHTKGVWARRGELLTLQPWQVFFICSVFGWVSVATGDRRYRTAVLIVPRKNGKSALAAAIGLYMMLADGEHGAEVYSGATTERQAWEVFRPAREMLSALPDLRKATGAEVAAKSLYCRRDGSRFAPVIGKPGDGASPSCAIVDEYHEHATNDLYETMITGMGARSQPLLLVTTTAGSDVAGPCYALQQDVERILDGHTEDDRTYGLLYGIDPGDDWTGEAALRKANPNYGVSVSGEYLREQQLKAIRSARYQSGFRAKHLNVWVQARDPFFNAESWSKLADENLKEENFVGKDCWVGIDLASKKDLTAKVKLFRDTVDGAEHYWLFPEFFLPNAQIVGGDKAHFAEWSAKGYITTTDGNVIDYNAIRASLVRDRDAHQVVAVGYDPWGATQLAQQLADEDGVPVIQVSQTVANLSEATKWLDALIEDGRLHHDGNPVMSWCIGNVTAKRDANDNVFPRREREESKIDGAVAAIIALAVAMRTRDAPLLSSPWDDPAYKLEVF